MKIFLHIGLHKTGSTFLQNFYFPLLERKNPKIIFNDKGILDILRKQYINNINENFKIDNLKIEKLINEQIKRLSSENNFTKPEDLILILSDENLIPDILFYKNKAELSEYIHYFNSFFQDPKILIFIREHKSFVYSQYNQHVKEGFYINFKDYIEKNQKPNIDLKKVNYNKIINNLNVNFRKRYYVFKHENFNKNLISLNKIFSSKINTDNIKNIKINKSLNKKQINILLFLEKNFKISKFESLINNFFSKFIIKKIDSKSFKKNKRFDLIFFILKVYNYILKLLINFKFSKIIKYINFGLDKKKEDKNNIEFEFEKYIDLDKFLFNDNNENK